MTPSSGGFERAALRSRLVGAGTPSVECGGSPGVNGERDVEEVVKRIAGLKVEGDDVGRESCLT